MNIKIQIGQRIQTERQAKGLTRKALAELTDDLKPSSINNWERGDRTPGPEEIKQLAGVLSVSPAYLMCLTDERQPKSIPGLGAIVPLLDFQEACNYKAVIDNIDSTQEQINREFIPISSHLAGVIGEYAFALKINDDSMHPEFRINDIAIIEPKFKLLPGCMAVAKLKNENSVLLRQYKQLTIAKEFSEYELRTVNENWGNIKINDKEDCEIIGIAICVIRYLQNNFRI